MMKIAFIHNRFPAGGAERITIDIARYLHDVGGYEVYVYAARVDQSLLTCEIEECLKIRVIPSQVLPS